MLGTNEINEDRNLEIEKTSETKETKQENKDLLKKILLLSFYHKKENSDKIAETKISEWMQMTK